jgi:ribosome-binding protein aMBF1 (putative translation factor)
MNIAYLGKDYFSCQMCGERGREKYKGVPTIPALVNWKEMTICKKCARREIGSKNKKGWDKLHDVGTNV